MTLKCIKIVNNITIVICDESFHNGYYISNIMVIYHNGCILVTKQKM